MLVLLLLVLLVGMVAVTIVVIGIVAVGIVIVGIVGVGIVIVGIVGWRCLSTISWLVTPGLHSAHVHCNHYHGDDEDEDDHDDNNDDNEGGAFVVDDGDDGDGCCINRWTANWFSDVDKREVALGRQHSMPASQFDEIRKVLDWVGTKIFLKYSKTVNLTSKVF